MIQLRMSYGDTTVIRTPLVQLHLTTDPDSGAVTVRAWPDIPRGLTHMFSTEHGMLTPARTAEHGGECLVFRPDSVSETAGHRAGSEDANDG